MVNIYRPGTEPQKLYDVVGGRLDLISATQIAWKFHDSNQIRLYNPSTQAWSLVSAASEPTIANTATDLNGTALVPNTIYDVFAEYSSATSFNLVLSRWSSDAGNGANNPNTSNATPAMTANTSGGVTVSSDISMYSGNSVYNGFDQVSGAGSACFHAATGGTSGYVLIDFGGPTIINKYAWFNQWDCPQRLPVAWTLYGSNDNSNWTSLDSRSSQSFTQNTWSSYYTFTNIMGYRYYKMAMTNRSGSDYLTFGELKLVTSQGTVAGASSRTVAYSASIPYAIGDRVTSSSHDFVCIQSGTGQTPAAGAYWVDNGTSVSGDFAGLYRHDGVLVQSSSTTGKSRRWLGILYTYNNSGTVNFKNDASYRFMSNYYNTLPKAVKADNSTSLWSLNGSWRESNNGTGQTRGLFVVATSQWITANSAFKVATCNADTNMCAVIDTTGLQSYTSGLPSVSGQISSQLPIPIGAGYHYLTVTEYGNFTVAGGVAYICNTTVLG